MCETGAVSASLRACISRRCFRTISSSEKNCDAFSELQEDSNIVEVFMLRTESLHRDEVSAINSSKSSSSDSYAGAAAVVSSKVNNEVSSVAIEPDVLFLLVLGFDG